MDWSVYERRMASQGKTIRNTSLLREQSYIDRKLPNNLSYQSVLLYEPEEGYNIREEDEPLHPMRDVAIINSDNLNEKSIIAMPGEDITLGSLVRWMDNYWLVTERDANSTVYVKCKMLQCNHILRWINSERDIIEQWCIVEDGTKYLTGEYEDRNFVVTRGDSRIAVTIARNEHTVRLDRENRFLIDDPDSPHKLAYLLTKPLKLGLTFNERGVYKFVLQEVTGTINDNHELGIADYYKYFEKETEYPEERSTVIDPNNIDERTGKAVWL